MNALHPRRIDEDLELRTRLRQIRNLAWQQLQGDRLAARDIEVGSNHRLDHRKEGPQDSIMIKAGHVVEPSILSTSSLVAAARALTSRPVRIETSPEKLDELPGNVDVAAQRLGEIALAVGDADLPEVAADGPQHADVTPVEIGTHHQRVETVGLTLADVGGREGVHEPLPRLECPAGTDGVGTTWHPYPKS